MSHDVNVFKKVLVVDDDEGDQIIIENILHTLGVEVDRCYDPFMALTRIGQRHYDAVLVDLHMPLMTGAELIPKIQELKPEISVFAVSGHFEAEIAELIKTNKLKVNGCISKDGLIKNLKVVFNGG